MFYIRLENCLPTKGKGFCDNNQLRHFDKPYNDRDNVMIIGTHELIW